MLGRIQDWSFKYCKYDISALSFYSYALDWIFYISMLVVFILYGTIIPPRYQEFSLQDISLMYSYKTEDETVIPIFLLILIAIVFPALQFVVCSFYNRRTLSGARQAWDVFVGLMCLCGSMATQLMITCILKNICGLPRPDLISRCEPFIGTLPPTPPPAFPPNGLVTVDVCTNDNIFILQEGFRSFPSGHSSTVFCGMVISSLNISGKLQVFDKRGISFKVILAIFPIMVACFVSCTRISDNRHFLRDVIGGSIIGTTVAVWFYLQYFPGVFHLENAGRAYPPRRIGVANFFNNVGGFWALEERLPGAFEERVLNTSTVITSLNDIDEAPSEHLMDPEELMDIPRNIEFFNKLGNRLKNTFLDLNHNKNILPA
ncbi:diacylglycerol pyrophosphate phosphatase [Scheffersomyces xylosifermentans]|uniref:diacylglycerol pyrophosphate phosphatase n=1 Tax=Scheffersomyces xylosifermentans TaxID=1304137 RepID=UPI00315D5DB5